MSKETPVTYACRTCGSKDVRWDAWAVWDEDAQEMVLETTFDHCECGQCEGETRTKELPITKPAG